MTINILTLPPSCNRNTDGGQAVSSSCTAAQLSVLWSSGLTLLSCNNNKRAADAAQWPSSRQHGCLIRGGDLEKNTTTWAPPLIHRSDTSSSNELTITGWPNRRTCTLSHDSEDRSSSKHIDRSAESKTNRRVCRFINSLPPLMLLLPVPRIVVLRISIPYGRVK